MIQLVLFNFSIYVGIKFEIQISVGHQTEHFDDIGGNVVFYPQPKIFNPKNIDTVTATTKISKPGVFYLPGLWTKSTQVSFYGTGYRMYWQTGNKQVMVTIVNYQ